MWLGWLWTAVYLGVVVVHCSHAVAIRGEARAWHAGHVVMALGMVAMVAPGEQNLLPRTAWEAVFVGVAGVVSAWLLGGWATGRRVERRWVGSLVDAGAMAYMFAFPSVANPVLTGVLVVYFTGVAVAWLYGAVAVATTGRRRVLPAALSPAAASDGSVGGHALRERVSLAAMTAGMAAMFVVMQFGS